MELALSLGHAPKPFSLFDKPPTMPTKDPGFSGKPAEGDDERRGSSDPPLQLDLLPFAPVPRPRPSSHPRIPWLSDARKVGIQPRAGAAVEDADHVTAVSSPNSNSASSFQMDLCFGNSNESRNKKEHECEADQRGSDDEENGSTRKKLRLSKQQSAFLEESFKLHPTLNPKQKVALAKYLNLRPRQVEVWFQNRRARTKLKQTEVDCEYLKRCCETLTEENKRLHKELQELRALKTTQPFYMQLPATTLTMCPSCERVATNSSSALPVTTPNQPTSVTTSHDASPVPSLVSLTKTTVVPFDKGEDHAQQDQPPNPAS